MVQELENQFNAAVDDKNAAIRESERCQLKLQLANRLINALASEGERGRWGKWHGHRCIREAAHGYKAGVGCTLRSLGATLNCWLFCTLRRALGGHCGPAAGRL